MQKKQQNLKRRGSNKTNTVATNTTRQTDNTSNDRCVIFGLGNPGLEYDGTRHNAGFLAVDHLRRAISQDGSPLALVKDRKLHCKIGSTTIGSKTVYLAQPQTFMNQSGNAIRSVVASLKVSHQNVVVIYDDMSLPCGSIQLTTEGGSRGQNGMKDVLNCLGHNSNFLRVRIGIGRNASAATVRKCEKVDYVLERFSEEDEMPLINEALKEATKAILAWINDQNHNAQIEGSEASSSTRGRKGQARC